MSSNGLSGSTEIAVPGNVNSDGLSLTRWRKFLLIVKVVELRLRFVALMAVTGLVFAYWDTIWNQYDKWMRPVERVHTATSDIEFFCPMHPQVVQEEPGQCPICGMTLARRPKGTKAKLPIGVTVRVQLPPSRVEQAGIKTTVVSYAPLEQTLTTVGYVAFDERRIANIISKVPGQSRVETLHVNFTGEDVAAGQPLVELYNPELNQAIQELRGLTGQATQAGEPKSEIGRALRDDWRAMVRASTEKLRLWGIDQAQIDDIIANRKSGFTFTILAPVRGHVYKKNVVAGQEVPQGYPMFEVVDLERVWVQAQVYEHQLGLVHQGQNVTASVEAFRGEVFPGKVEFLQPHLDPATRTVEVRYSLENPGRRLRPGMFATVTLKTPIATAPPAASRLAEEQAAKRNLFAVSLSPDEQKNCPVTRARLGSMGKPIGVEIAGRKVWTCCGDCPGKLKAEPARYLADLAPVPQGQVLSVPESAVIDTGTRQVVYVESEAGVFEGREVVLGPRVNDRFPVLSGLAAGEKVAAAGAFLIDAESRLNAGAAAIPFGEATKIAEALNERGEVPANSTHRH